MEFLQASDDDDNDEERNPRGDRDADDEATAVVAVKSKWVDCSDDSDDDDDNAGNVSQINSSDHTGYLPRANDLFSSVIPQFSLENLRSKNEGIIKSKNYVPTEPTVIPVATFEKKKTFAAVVPKQSNEKEEAVDSRKLSTESKTSSMGASAVKGATPKPLVPKQKEVDKDTAKDRVKRQRLSGQSGIGADFKTWKSEEEMRQRQQYD
jgi:hypothetical protein